MYTVGLCVLIVPHPPGCRERDHRVCAGGQLSPDVEACVHSRDPRPEARLRGLHRQGAGAHPRAKGKPTAHAAPGPGQGEGGAAVAVSTPPALWIAKVHAPKFTPLKSSPGDMTPWTTSTSQAASGSTRLTPKRLWEREGAEEAPDRLPMKDVKQGTSSNSAAAAAAAAKTERPLKQTKVRIYWMLQIMVAQYYLVLHLYVFTRRVKSLNWNKCISRKSNGLFHRSIYSIF